MLYSPSLAAFFSALRTSSFFLLSAVSFAVGRSCQTLSPTTAPGHARIGLHRIPLTFRPFLSVASHSQTSRGTVSALARGGWWRLALRVVVSWMHPGGNFAGLGVVIRSVHTSTLNPNPEPSSLDPAGPERLSLDRGLCPRRERVSFQAKPVNP